MTSTTTTKAAQSQPQPATRIWAAVGLLGALYALMLDYLENRYPVNPRHTWIEVVGGVLLTTIPPAVVRRLSPQMSAADYERLVAGAFVASGAPIITWQLARYWRQK